MAQPTILELFGWPINFAIAPYEVTFPKGIKLTTLYTL